MPTTEIFNFIAIDDKIGTGGQPTKEQLAAAQTEGYQAVINLAPGIGENALPGEDQIVRALDMEYHHIPVEWTNPRPENFAAFAAAMKTLSGKKVLIHCAANYRVTAFFSSYALKYLGWTAEQADALVARIWAANPEYKMDETWRTFVAGIRR